MKYRICFKDDLKDHGFFEVVIPKADLIKRMQDCDDVALSLINLIKQETSDDESSEEEEEII